MVLRPAQDEDLPVLLEIEAEAFPGNNWRALDFSSHRCVVAEVDGVPAGFVVTRQTFTGDGTARAECEILNLAVRSAFRRLGVATQLLSGELASGHVHFLEVRESNAAARNLYQKLGFAEIARRSDYYENPTETAIVMQVK